MAPVAVGSVIGGAALAVGTGALGAVTSGLSFATELVRAAAIRRNDIVRVVEKHILSVGGVVRLMERTDLPVRPNLPRKNANAANEVQKLFGAPYRSVRIWPSEAGGEWKWDEHPIAAAADSLKHGIGGRVRMLFEVLAYLPRELILVGVDAKRARLSVEAKRELEGSSGFGLAMVCGKRALARLLDERQLRLVVALEVR